MKNVVVVFLGLICATPVLNTAAQTPQQLTLDSLIEAAVGNNSNIKAYYEQIKSIDKRSEQFGYLPDPEIGYTYFINSVETRVGPQRQAFSLSQRFPLWNKRGLQKGISNEDASIKAQQAGFAKIELRFRVQTAFYELWRARQSRSLATDYRAILGDFEQIAATRYAIGEGMQQSILKAQLEKLRLEKLFLGFDEEESAALSTLDGLLNRTNEEPLAVEFPPLDVPTVDFDRQKLVTLALETRPDLEALQLFLNKQDLLMQYARKQAYPDLTVSVSYVHVEDGTTTNDDDGKNPLSISLRLNLPIWRGKYASGIDEARLAKSAGVENLHDLQAVIESQVSEILSRVSASGKTLNLYEQQLIPQAESVLASVLANYQTGKTDFLSLLDAFRTLFDLKMASISEMADLHQNIARLEKVVGTKI